MTTITSAHAAIDAHTATQMAGYATVIYGNTLNPALSQGTVPYLSQRVLLLKDSQFELGRPQTSRKRGSIVFTIHVRTNAGDGPRNVLLDRVLKSFRSKRIGGATFMDARVLPGGQTENWSLTGVEIPFYFDEQ